MKWIEQYHLQIAAVLGVLIVLGVGRAKILPAVRSSALLLWLAFVVTVFCGLVLGWALAGVVAWATHLSGTVGGIAGGIGALIAVWLGWHAVFLLVALIRDVADKQPDEDARKAALWVPLFLPAGWQAVWGIVSHPRGLGTGITAAVMAAITVVYAHRVVKASLTGKSGRKAWRWFAALACLFAGIVLIPLLAYVDAQAAHWAALPPWALVMGRIILGAVGLGLLVAAFVDIKDKVPDAAVRAFLAYGLPVLALFGLLTIGFLGGHAHDGLQVLTGSVR
jgi:hypothetical protein